MRSVGSTCIHTGTMPLKETEITVNSTPVTKTASTAWETERRALSLSPAPQAFAMNARKPTPMADTVLFTSQLTVLVAPTAAVAVVPSAPTMAVSIYCTAVCISCSSMVGQASERMTPAMARRGLSRNFFIRTSKATFQLL